VGVLKDNYLLLLWFSVGQFGLVEMTLSLINLQLKLFCSVLYRGTHWLRFWSQLEKNDHKREVIRGGCIKPETAAMQIFVDHG
jgi:hypothetical protein